MTDPTAADYALVDKHYSPEGVQRDQMAFAMAELRAEYEAKLADERAAHEETKECLRRVVAFTRHSNWCACLSPSAFENGGDYSNNPPCNCGATEGFEMFERLFPDHDHGEETRRTLAWRDATSALKARLALAEAVCEWAEKVVEERTGMGIGKELLAAWRDAK